MEKYCNRCDTTKPVSEFNKNAKNKDSLAYYCRQCASQTAKDWYEINKEKAKKSKKAWREKNPDYFKEYGERRRSLRYGITIEQYNDLLDQQNNRCAICRQENEDGKPFHIDHDHSCCKGIGSCGECVRGLLCSHCNWMLGYARDNPETLEEGANYVKRHARPKNLEKILT